MSKMSMNDTTYLLYLLDNFVTTRPLRGSDPTFYHTGTYAGDLEMWKKIQEIKSHVDFRGHRA